MKILLSFLFILISVTGCSGVNQVHFSELLKDDVEKLSYRNGAGVTYSTVDKELISQFINIMESINYSKTKNPRISGSSRVTFYDKDEKEIVMITFVGGYFYINHDNTYYGSLPNEELKSFYQEFFIDENIEK